MVIKQKLVIDKEFTNNFQIIVRDETGTYNPSNTTGYGGQNGNPIVNFDKYIFELCNISTGDKYIQVQSDDITNPDEFYNPSIGRIANKENVTLDANNFGLQKLLDGLYKLKMTVKLIPLFDGDGAQDTNVIVNVPAAEGIYDTYKSIVVGREVYTIIDISFTSLILDRPIKEAFNKFSCGLSTSTNFILSQDLEDCINGGIANLSSDSCCNSDTKSINLLSEIQLYLWGCNRCIDANDIMQATEYFTVANKLSKSLNNRNYGR